ncbi:hypothetical protein AC578_8380 [Pseudocercospora eumusae]|uniref:histidine kinase n=1 Tax=Pseudocercospora eumusae TaxID=321146 RepID=A0A139HSB6_9PEZI|nr:hypothetical protein AC578_8380 [Pseudocercospora eumusae]
MRIPIYLQLASLLLISSLIGLAVISIAVWITTHNFVLDIRASRLSITASLKAAELASNLDVMQTSAGFVSTRVLIQEALARYNDQGNNTDQNWSASKSDLHAAIGGMASLGQRLLLQARVYPKNDTGVNGRYSLLNVTSQKRIYPLPYKYPNGSSVILGDEGPAANGTGFPSALYPDLVYGSADDHDNSQVSLKGQEITSGRTLVLGPWPTSDTVSLMSLTLPIEDNNKQASILGYLTVVMDAQLILDTVHSRDGLMDTGQTLLVSPESATNRFSGGLSNSSLAAGTEVRYVTPVQNGIGGRHSNNVDNTQQSFNTTKFTAINKALENYGKNESDRSGSALRAKNEAKKAVSVGYAFPNTTLVDWLVLVEQSRAEVWQPITTLRKVIVASLFATFGLMVVISFPLARFASTPILRLRDATRRYIDPSQSGSRSSLDSLGYLRDGPADKTERVDDAAEKKEGFVNPIIRWKLKREQRSRANPEERRKRVFKIPGKVKERKWWIRDELTDLTSTFNEMSDELMMQYTKLEERVQQRTAELELSKVAAEAANESKTLFIANISHELKTPLNGILGMCAVCMQEEDPLRLKRSLGIIYKSGDLLLNLLTDLLTFSKNQVGQHLSLDEKEFRLRDIQSQALAIFDKQANDGQIDLRVEFEGISNPPDESFASDRQSALGPAGTGRMRDMILWGDVHRILQVVINLLSNSLKFTPPGGSVVLTIRALTEPPDMSIRSPSIGSRQSRMNSSRHRTSEVHTVHSLDELGTANSINPKGKPSQVSISERNVSPPPGRYIYFEFEVADTGPGIKDDLQQKIFEPFVQGDIGLSKKFGGTGLGLSICSQLASLMKGSISLRSTLGLGSTFTLKIPLRHLQTRADSSASSAVERPGIESDSGRNSFDEARASPRASIHGPVEFDPTAPSAAVATEQPKAPVTGDLNNSNPRLVGLSQPFFASNQPLESPGSQPAAMDQIEAAAKRGGKIRVLVAEDNKVNQEVVLRMLKLEDIYDVTVAKDGQEALDIVKDTMASHGQPFNLIFMDVHMPNLNGIESTKMIREMGYNAPIVALTAYSEENNVKDCLDSGMNYFLSKPIRRPQLKKVLKEYCAPIPEEPEENAPDEEQRRGSGHSGTMVMVNNHAGPAAPATFVTQELSNGQFENTTDLFSARNSSSTTNTTGDHVRHLSKPPRAANMDTHDITPTDEEVCRFFRLPKELRDEIYRFAFASENDHFKIIMKAKWMQNERSRREMNNRRQSSFVPRVASECPLLGMRVNKQFFREATSQWLSNTTIECHDGFDVNNMLEHSTALRENMVHFHGDWNSSSLLSKTRWHMYSCFRGLRLCQNMRSLRLVVCEGAFEAFESRMSCVDNFTDADFKTIMEVRSMLNMNSLASVTLEPEKSKLAVSEHEKKQWRSNVAALEAYINRKLKERDAQKKLQATGKHAREEDNFVVKETKKLKAARAAVEEKIARSNESFASLEASHGSVGDCRSILGFTRHHPAAAAMITTAFTLSLINSIVLAKQLLG